MIWVGTEHWTKLNQQNWMWAATGDQWRDVRGRDMGVFRLFENDLEGFDGDNTSVIIF